jgi:hypothetical protein
VPAGHLPVSRRSGNGHLPFPAVSHASQSAAKAAYLQENLDGETRTRTGDTTIFSRVLYQLSYLAVAGKG